jgi:hypothetical protein
VVTFGAAAAEVRDASKSLDERALALKHCVQSYKPIGYRATIAYLRESVAATGDGWTEDQLLRALDLLEESRVASLAAKAEWDAHRRREKAIGRRVPSRVELEGLRARPWMTWPRPQADSRSMQSTSGDDVRPLPFRRAQADDFARLQEVMPQHRLSWSTAFSVTVYDDLLSIPGRIYNPEVPADTVAELTPAQRTMLHCLYTRHHDGYVRQRHLACVITSLEPWVAPYVVELIGEYVVEIIADIRAGLADLDQPGSAQRRQYGRFVESNRAHFDLVSHRVQSYWANHYRHSYRKPSRSHADSPWLSNAECYPGFVLVDSLRRAAEEFR